MEQALWRLVMNKQSGQNPLIGIPLGEMKSIPDIFMLESP